MANKVVTTTAKDGAKIEFVIKPDPPEGAMKYVFFSPQKDYVVAFFKKRQDARSMSRLESITGKYRSDIYDQIGGDFWKELFCWPERMVEWQGNTGIVVPAYAKHFFFQYDKNLMGEEKQGKWFASAKLLRNIDPQERGDFLSYLRISLNVARAVRRMHAAGLAHSDLSYKNVLIDPHGGNACIIDVDGLVVPGKYPPDVLGTPDFIAPEVLCDRTNKVLPSQETDKHALAVLIYMYLLHRHPLQGGRFFGPDVDEEEEEELRMGSQPLYIEHPTDHSNRNMKREYGRDYDKCRPWVDLDHFGAEKIAGPFLASLFMRAFTDGLKDPRKRPLANEWESALVKTADRLQPCSNPKCIGKWYVFDGSRRCPFCGTAYKGLFPKLEFYSCKPGKTSFLSENYQLMVFDGQPLSKWHVNKKIFPNEKLSVADKARQGYFRLYNGKWFLVNEKLPSMYEIMPDGSKSQKKPGEYAVLEHGTRILLSTEEGGRLVVVQMTGG